MINQKSVIKVTGIMLAIMWASYVPDLFPHPFQEKKGIRDLAIEYTKLPDWLKQESRFNDKTADELEKEMMTELRIEWIKSVLFIVIGVLSGCLLIQHRKAGYLLAFFSSLLFIGIGFVNLLRYGFHIEHYGFMLHRAPVRTIQGILMQLVILGTVILLIYVYVTQKHRPFISKRHDNAVT
jgi:hypothetical protein